MAQPWALPWAWALLWAWELAWRLPWAQPWALAWVLAWVLEHLILWLEVVHEEEAVGVPSRLLVDPVQLVLQQQSAQLFDDGLQLVLVAQPPAAEELLIDPHDEPQLL